MTLLNESPVLTRSEVLKFVEEPLVVDNDALDPPRAVVEECLRRGDRSLALFAFADNDALHQAHAALSQAVQVAADVYPVVDRGAELVADTRAQENWRLDAINEEIAGIRTATALKARMIIDAALERTATAMRLIEVGLAVPQPETGPAAETRLAAVKVDLRMLGDGCKTESEAVVALRNELAVVQKRGDVLTEWLLVASGWAGLYLRSRGGDTEALQWESDVADAFDAMAGDDRANGVILRELARHRYGPVSVIESLSEDLDRMVEAGLA